MGSNIDPGSFLGAAAGFAVVAFIYIRNAERIKLARDIEPMFEWQRQFNRTISVSTYRAFGWMFAVLSLAALTGAIIVTLMRL